MRPNANIPFDWQIEGSALPLMRAERLSKLLRAPGADWIVAIISVLGTAFLLGLATWRRNPAIFAGPYSTYTPLVALSLFCGVFGWFGVKTWRKLWRSGRTPLERIVYDRGVRGFGAMMIIALPIVGGAVALALAGNSQDPAVWMFVAASIFMAIPLSLPMGLWAGYAWGWIHAGALSQGNDDTNAKSEEDLPPII
jgi:hypothetical protein